MKVIKININNYNLVEDSGQDISEWRNIIYLADPNIVGTWL